MTSKKIPCTFSDCTEWLVDLETLQVHLFEDHGIFSRYKQEDTIAICYDRFDRLWTRGRFCFRWMSTILETLGTKFGLICEERKRSMFMWVVNLGKEEDNKKQFRFKIEVFSKESEAKITGTGRVLPVEWSIPEMLAKGEHLYVKRVQLFEKFLTRVEGKRYWYATFSVWEL